MSNPTTTTQPETSQHSLVQVRGLKKSFQMPERELHVLKEVDLDLYPGELVSLVGQSGVGKSTLLHILGTLDRPTSGNIMYDGQDPFAMSDKELAIFRNRFIGFVFQFHHLLPEFSALENVMMPALIHRTSRKEAEEYAAHLLQRTGLEDRMSHRPSELSGGEQQRVAMARALVMKPRLVLADEPTGNLDPQTSHEIHSLLLELNQETGITFLVATHNFALAGQMQRHLRIHDGRVEDTHREALLEQGTFLQSGEAQP